MTNDFINARNIERFIKHCHLQKLEKQILCRTLCQNLFSEVSILGQALDHDYRLPTQNNIVDMIKIYHIQEQYQIGNVDSRSIKSCHLQNYTQTNSIYKINFTSHFVFITTCFYCCTIGNNSKLTEAAFFCFCTLLDVLTDLLKFVFRSPYKRGLVRAELIPAI